MIRFMNFMVVSWEVVAQLSATFEELTGHHCKVRQT